MNLMSAMVCCGSRYLWQVRDSESDSTSSTGGSESASTGTFCSNQLHFLGIGERHQYTK